MRAGGRRRRFAGGRPGQPFGAYRRPLAGEPEERDQRPGGVGSALLGKLDRRACGEPDDARLFAFFGQAVDAAGVGAVDSAKKEVHALRGLRRADVEAADRQEFEHRAAGLLARFATGDGGRRLAGLDQSGNDFEQARPARVGPGADPELLDHHHFVALRVVEQDGGDIALFDQLAHDRRAHPAGKQAVAQTQPRQPVEALVANLAREDFEVGGRRVGTCRRWLAHGASSASALIAALRAIRHAVTAFFERFALPSDDYLAEEEQAVFRLEGEKDTLLAKDRDLETRVNEAKTALGKAREARMAYEETGRETKVRILELAETRAREESAAARLEARSRELSYLAEELQRERAEVLPLAGAAAFSYEPLASLPDEDRKIQEERKRVLDRLKIRVEEAGGTGEEVRTEYNETKSREEFLARELHDLAQSAEGLESLIDELDDELAKTFADGLAQVNRSFTEYFALMFGGGGAKLALEELDGRSDDEDDDAEEEAGEEDAARREKPGLEVVVNLPKKRVQALMQLSGGERALTSIALIFAMSQVNPPPFLILDETDAALDEANSRRYGDMIENLAKHSQLVVITHNRETMSRAGILYGVTMGSDAVSKLLSVRFDEAAAVAK